ncbi:unnamed protein product [Dovyalis caffra]|uniref:Uncharacterized protein n=1 Tax=Dovyalis caffra TaxID=77055 RepID=A0AAV1RJF2_9ROSI|nr:unnamed protein product [Dovyalis caffra]
MEIDRKTGNIEALSIGKGEINDGQNQDTGVTSAHTIGHDSWEQMGLMLVGLGASYPWLLLDFTPPMLAGFWQDFISLMAEGSSDTEILWGIFMVS